MKKKFIIGILTVLAIIATIGISVYSVCREESITEVLNIEGKTEKRGSSLSSIHSPILETSYLVDKVQIGDYVDIGIEYSNQMKFNSNYTEGDYSDEGMTGWRVLSKSGNGQSGTVTLVAAGTPLTFYHPESNASETSLIMINDLNKEINLVGKNTQGFVNNGFKEGNNLNSIFSNCSYIDTNKGVHALNVSEIETAYNTLTGSEKNIDELKKNEL